MWECLGNPAVANLAQWIYALATTAIAFSAIWAAFKALPNEFAKSRRAKEAESAAAVFVAALKFVRALQYLASPLSHGGGTSGTTAEEWYGRKLDEISGELDGFYKAQIKAEVHLSQDVIEALEALRKKFVEMKSEFSMVKVYRDGRMLKEASEAWNKAVGDKVHEELEQLASRLKTLLRPIARLEAQ